jgi:hypothetical protein
MKVPTQKAELWIIEWSERNHQFHINEVDSMLQSNREGFLNRYGMDWQPIAIVSDLDDAQPLIDRLEDERRRQLPAVIHRRMDHIYSRRANRAPR